MATARVEARRAATRKEILDAAWAIAREEGLGAIGIRKLASGLGMAASSLYGYFDGKDAIYDEMFVQGNDALRAHFAGLNLDGDARSALIEATRAFIEFCDEDHARFQLLFQHSIPGWEPSAAAYATAVETYEQMEFAMAGIGITDPAAIDMWTALMSGLASQQVANDPGGERWLRLAEQAVDMYLSIGRE